MTAQEAETGAPAQIAVFRRILVGVDGSAEAFEAARQATLLRDPDGAVTILAAWDLAPPVIGGTGTGVPYYFDDEAVREQAERAVEAARGHAAALGSAAAKVARGPAWQVLLDEVEREHSTLVAVGSHGVGRARGVIVGATATELVHKAPCSVLVARRAGERFPRRILVGVDGSLESVAALAVATDLSARFGAELRTVVASGGHVDRDRIAQIVGPRHEEQRGDPVWALVVASGDADLLVVGSRGLRGLKSLGSVSERVAHGAQCSTLIVRQSRP